MPKSLVLAPYTEGTTRPGTFRFKALTPEMRQWVLDNKATMSCKTLGAFTGRSAEYISRFIITTTGEKKPRAPRMSFKRLPKQVQEDQPSHCENCLMPVNDAHFGFDWLGHMVQKCPKPKRAA